MTLSLAAPPRPGEARVGSDDGNGAIHRTVLGVAGVAGVACGDGSARGDADGDGSSDGAS